VASSVEIQRLHKAALLLCRARSAVALTGAGISTASGIPDFRSPGSGLWERCDPMRVASLAAFRHHPEDFFAWVRPLAESVLRADPNPAHLALAQLERSGLLAGLITQNIDGLHQRAGSRVVVEVHGHFRESTCVSCFRVFPTQPFLEAFVAEGKPPACPACGRYLKPNVVLFGEQLPWQEVQRARELLSRCDLVLVVGSSLEVTPVALFPQTALDSGACLIIINREPTYLDIRADVRFFLDAAEVLPWLVAEVLDEQRAASL
jgi:NAD-dependent deacetylase